MMGATVNWDVVWQLWGTIAVGFVAAIAVLRFVRR